MIRITRCIAALLFIATAAVAAQEPADQAAGTASPSDKILFVNEQQTLSPGFAIGNIAIGNDTVADMKVLPGRREVLLFGKQAGQTMLTLWDQKNVKRAEIVIRVTTREAVQMEDDLKELLKDFPSVRLQTLGGAPVIAGAVSSEDDLAAIERIAAAAGVQSVVRYVPPARRPGAGQPVGQAPPSGGETGSGATTSGTAGVAAVPEYEIEYEVQVMETSVAFVSGMYGEGVQPAGRRLYTGRVRTALGMEKELYIDGTPLMPKDVDKAKKQQKKTDKGAATSGVGLRLRLLPQPPTEETDDSAIRTLVVLQTNLPYQGAGSTYDPSVWRTGRWNIDAAPETPIGIAGGDMLAIVPTTEGSGPGALQRIGSIAGVVGAVPGVSGLPGGEYASAAGSIPYYDKQKKTHLLLLLTPRLVPAARR